MAKKIRVWYCVCCKRMHNRKKSETSTFNCSTCSCAMKKGTKYYTIKECKHTRIKNKVLQFKERHYSKLRNAGGKRLRISCQTKQLWKSLDKAKHKPTFLSRANEWLKSLQNDIFANFNENDYCKTLDRKGLIQKTREGKGNCPPIKWQPPNKYELGIYHRHLLMGIREIRLTEGRILAEIKLTLLHEALHYLDDVTNINDANHDCYFNKRLKILEGIFKIK